MKSAARDRFSWPQRSFWGMVVALFLVQVGLILLFSDRSRLPAPLSHASVHFRALGASAGEDQLLRQFFAGDPAVFPLPNPHGFSGRGWLDQSPLTYKDETQLKPPIWLNLDAARLRTNFLTVPTSLSRFVANLVSGLGTNFLNLPAGAQPALSGLAEHQGRREEPYPVFLAPEIIPTQSVFRVVGGLNDRLLGRPSLRTWPSDKLLSNSVVQIAVDPVGEVVAARLDTGSGLAEADAEAVTTVRTLRFRPARAAGTRWGNAVFQWQTTEPPAAAPPK